MKTQFKQEKGGVMPTVKIGVSRQVVIPKKFYEKLGLVPGDYFEVELEDDRLVLTPKMLVEKRLAEGLADIRHGRVVGPIKTARSAMRALKTQKQ
jgi:AbrB family looped-hinge helix DNA binding protein